MDYTKLHYKTTLKRICTRTILTYQYRFEQTLAKEIHLTEDFLFTFLQEALI